MKLGFLGFGLIGGSIARSLKRKEENLYIQVYTRRKNAELEKGVTDGIINRLVYNIDSSFSDCDIIFLCAPTLTNISFLKKLKPLMKPDCILTDVGSVKGNIHKEIIKLKMESSFIGGHPMAGSEKTGYENSNTTLLENAYYLLTPTKKTSAENLRTMKELVSKIGSVCIVLSPMEHDNITAAISHVPHIVAAALVNLARIHDVDYAGLGLKDFAAGGFKDITRIASSSPEMWQNIMISNADSIRFFLKEYIGLLNDFHMMLKKKERKRLEETFQDAGNYRDAIPSKNKSMLSRCFEVFVDIADETGAIATIATILAKQDISIKNIGIIHNREFADGVLRIELYQEQDAVEAEAHLRSRNYIICSRS